MAERKIKDIYIVHVDRYIGAYRCGKCPSVMYAKGDRFIDFIESLREDYPDYRLRCVKNYGIEDEIRRVILNDIQRLKLEQIGKVK